MKRILLVLLLLAAALAVAKATAPLLLILAAIGVILAWKRPELVGRVSNAHRLERMPASLRATPMRFSATVAAAAIGLVVLSAPIGASADEAPEPSTDALPVARETAADATPRPTASPTEQATLAATASPTPALGEAPTGPLQFGTVVEIIDGDTIDVDVDGEVLRIRYIGVDTPETRNGLEWMGAEAAAANAALVLGEDVVLERDVSETDQYGRLLRYVWIDHGDGWLLVNLELLRLGFAQITTYPPDVKYADTLYPPAERQARDRGVGLWGTPPTPVPTPTPAPTPVPTVAPTAGPILPVAPQPPSNCEPSYPDFCIPIGSGDLDCPDVAWRQFTVLWSVSNPDPHRFDGDSDGIGCES